jgi:hypothetical protein
MMCPLLAIALGPTAAKVQQPLPECQKEECAWWEETQGLCCIKNMGRMLGYMSLDTTQFLKWVKEKAEI